MKTLILILSLLVSGLSLIAQVSPNKYYIEFVDKANNQYSLSNPEEFLTERSLQRRAVQGIELDISDLPVTQIYIDSLQSLGLQILNVSKWFNSVTVYSLDSMLIDTITNLDFVSNSAKYKPVFDNKTPINSKYNKPRSINVGYAKSSYYDYGQSSDQIVMHNGQLLHNRGFRGQGMLIAVTDAGFKGLPNLPAFDSLYAAGRVVATRNFVHGGVFVNDFSTHGMRVLSILAGNYPGNLIGAAPEADYLLLMSEDPDSETFIEELNWISAAEFADSLGADIINVSLGYLDFDTPEFNHTYQQLDGNHAMISIAATTTSRKGMIVVASAANSGESETHPWIAAPGDADEIITAGAVWSNQAYASFSSIGPSYDGRVKPDVVAMGAGTTNQNLDGTIGTGNGTSFSSPILSGMIACLWQQFPEKTNTEIMNAVRQSAHLYNTPNNFLGYGIPDFDFASKVLTSGGEIVKEMAFSTFPNPYEDKFSIQIKNNVGDSIQLIIKDITGRNTYLWMEYNATEQNVIIPISDLSRLKSGVYIVSVIVNTVTYTDRIIKK